MTNPCARCGRPTDATVCHDEAQTLASALTAAAGHAEDAWTVIARQARVHGAGGTRRTEPDPAPPAQDLRRNRVTAFGWQASIEQPTPGALRPEPAPADLGAFDRYAAIANTIGTWTRHVLETRGTQSAEQSLHGPPCPDDECEHDTCESLRSRGPLDSLPAATRWLATQARWLRKRPDAAEAFDDLEQACRALERLVDRPPDRELVGMCDCGRVLYAAHGREAVTCPVVTCRLRWNVEESREILRRALDDKLVTAADGARLAQYLDTDRTQQQIRKLINKWAERGRIEQHGQIDGEPAYRFGDIAVRLAAAVRRDTMRGHAGRF